MKLDPGPDRESCPALGRPCPAAWRLAGRLAIALRAARAATGPEFRLDGRAELDGCRAGCTARITTTADLVRVECTSGPSIERPIFLAHNLN